jgi:endoglucanase
MSMRLGRWFIICVQLGIALALFLVIDGKAATSGNFIRAEGKDLVDGNGARFAVKGINLGNWLVPEGYMFKFPRARAPTEIEAVVQALVGPQDAARFWTEFRDVYVAKEDIAFIKAAGFNTVRVPLHWRLFVKPGAPGEDKFEGPGWSLLDRLVEWSRDAGLRVILDLHAAPGGQTGVNHDDGPGFPLVFYVPRYRELTIELWRRLALHYSDEPAILGYDLLNEPISPYNDEAYLNPRLEPLYRDVVAAIRSVDSKHAVILAGAQWSTSFAAFSRPFDDNAIYSYHKFWATPTRDAVQSYVDFGNRWNVPLLIGETGEGSYEWNAKFRLLNEKFGIGWCFWPYKNLESQTSVVSIREPAGWKLVAHAGSAAAPIALDPPVSREQALTILNAYLEAARFANVRVNKDYLVSLGLAAP